MWLDRIPNLRWAVIEQPHFAALGKAEFANEYLTFHSDLKSCLEHRQPSVAVLSAVLPYLADPFAVIAALRQIPFQAIVIDRTGFNTNGGNRITLQRNPRSLFSTSYPCWFFDQEQLIAAFGSDYKLTYESSSGDADVGPLRFKCLILERRIPC
jgi:putative methyltransferase (TIGR04325 family)